MEIERKYLIYQIPDHLDRYPFHQIEQAYLNTKPVIRIRKEDDHYYLTYKSSGLLEREEYNLALTPEAYCHLLPKADGNIITKKRYLIPLEGNEHLTVELDIFEGTFDGLMMAEVEFTSREEADTFKPPNWFGKNVTFYGLYQNSHLSTMDPKQLDLI